MVIISKAVIVDFVGKHADSTDAFNKWYEICKKANWKNLAEVKKVFSTLDFVGNDRYVFNIKGNKYRLVAMIFFSTRTMYIRFIGTHAEYNEVDCSTV